LYNIIPDCNVEIVLTVPLDTLIQKLFAERC